VDWISSLSGNLVAGFIGTFLTVFFIDKALEKERQARSQKFQRFVLSGLRPTLLCHLNLLCAWYKAASRTLPEPRPSTLDALFGESYYDQIRYLDFSKAAPTHPPVSWFEWTAHELESFGMSIRNVLDKYTVLLEPELVELLDSLENSALTKALITTAGQNLPDIDKRDGIRRSYNVFAGQGFDVETHRHIQSVLKAIAKHNEFAARPITVGELYLWRIDVSPHLGSARIDSEIIEPAAVKMAIGPKLPLGGPETRPRLGEPKSQQQKS
jgi:hypothetical protein